MGSLTESLSSEILMLFREASRSDHARTSVAPEKAQESTENAQECGWKWPGSFAKWHPATSSWKTRQCSLLEGLDEFSETWPRWGSMQDGECCPLPTPERHTNGNEFGLLPTICASEGRDISKAAILAKLDKGGRVARRLSSTLIPECQDIVGLNPCFAEWMQGMPQHWTDLKPSETHSIQAWLHSHGKF
jgi:hypothetical protein